MRHVYRWDIMWAPLPREIAEEYLATGAVHFRKNGKLDLRYRASRLVARFFPDATEPRYSPDAALHIRNPLRTTKEEGEGE